jgi:hypothetical protein
MTTHYLHRVLTSMLTSLGHLCSAKCLSKGNTCEYPALEVWRSDTADGRPNFVGRQLWFAVWQLPKAPQSPQGRADPFDTLAASMPLKSRQLLQYRM